MFTKIIGVKLVIVVVVGSEVGGKCVTSSSKHNNTPVDSCCCVEVPLRNWVALWHKKREREGIVPLDQETNPDPVQ